MFQNMIGHMMRCIAFQETEFSFPKGYTRETQFRVHKGYNKYNGQRRECGLSISAASTQREKRCESSRDTHEAIMPIKDLL